MLTGWLLLQASTEHPLPGGYGASLVQSLLALVAVCILAWVVLRWSAKAGLGMARGEHLEVLERLALDPRRSVLVVRVGKRLLLLGVGDNAAPSLLSELDPKDLPASAVVKKSFFEVLRSKQTGASTLAAEDVGEPEAAVSEGISEGISKRISKSISKEGAA